jgi:hypothetical protein
MFDAEDEDNADVVSEEYDVDFDVGADDKDNDTDDNNNNSEDNDDVEEGGDDDDDLANVK